MVARYETINKFIKNIYYAKGIKFDEDYTTMWIREITATGADIFTLQKAEQEIIRNNVPLKIFDVVETIKENKEVIALPIPPKTKCNYCNGKGYVVGLFFDKDGIYTGYRKALNCVCGNATMVNMLMMKEDISNNHRTECRDGYYRIFPSIVEEFAYIDKLEKNKWKDLRRN